jgi:putative addiction module CopG family antidote
VTLTPKQQLFVQRRVSSGGYESAAEVFREALRLLEREEADRITRSEISRKIDKGLDEARRGLFVDSDQVFGEMAKKRRLAAKAKKEAK